MSNLFDRQDKLVYRSVSFLKYYSLSQAAVIDTYITFCLLKIISTIIIKRRSTEISLLCTFWYFGRPGIM